MNQLTIAYANHRPETIRLSATIMFEHEALILEEPHDSNLQALLDDRLSIDDYLLGQEIEYPAFSTEQCRLLKDLHRANVIIMQAEPYYEHLFRVQNFFADGHAPAELDQSTEQYLVYSREKEATGKLIDYYRSVQTQDFDHIICSVQAFAAADAARFRLRDRLRARAIAALITGHSHVCVEAGPMHLLLYRYLRESLTGDWLVRPVFVEQRSLKKIDGKARLYGPGDVLTAHYLLGHALPAEQRNLLAARALVSMKIIEKEEMSSWRSDFPHLKNESKVNRIVNELSYDQCRRLFAETASLTTVDALQLVQQVVSST